MGKLLYAVVAYALSLFVVAWSVAFVGGFALAHTIDADASATGAPPAVLHALVVDAALLLLFAVQHSVMARPAFKRVWTRLVPPPVERATYVLATSAVLALLMVGWEPIPAIVWRTAPGSAANVALWCAYALGWVIVLVSTWLVDHFHLFGLRQAWRALRNEAERDPTFTAVLLYRLVRHPLMLGFLVAFWAAPTMTVGHLVFALATTAYILVGVRLEERDLRAAIGDTYERYREDVPNMVLPLPRLRRR